MLKIFSHPLVLLSITIISIIFSISLYQSAQKTSYSTENLKSVEQEILELEQDVSSLETTIQQSQQPFAKEQIIRNELLMKKNGEYVVQIPDELIKTTQTTTEVSQASPWEEWLQLLD